MPPWASTDEATESYPPQAVGPVILALPVLDPRNPAPATIAAGATWDSGVLAGDGYTKAAVSATSSASGMLTVQRYLDLAGTVLQGASGTATLGSGAALVNLGADGFPFATWRVRISNSSGSTATISGFAALLAAA